MKKECQNKTSRYLDTTFKSKKLESSLKPKEMKERSEAYLQGLQKNINLVIPERSTFNLIRKKANTGTRH